MQLISSRFVVTMSLAVGTMTGFACGGSGDAPPASESAPLAPVAAPSPRLSINALMVTMIDNSGHVLWDVEREGMAPKNEADWLEVEDHATQLVAAGTLLQVGGTGQADMGWVRQVGWADNANKLSDAAQAALTAAKSRDLDALIKANGDLVETCETCHKAFKPDAPTEGIVHQRPHSESAPGR